MEYTNPESSVYPSSIVKTCTHCHGSEKMNTKYRLPVDVEQTYLTSYHGAGEQLGKGSVHLRPSFNKDKIIFYVSTFYIVLILLVIGGMLFHNFLDLGKKMAAHYRESKAKGVLIRLTRNERIQHIVLLVSFLILVYTGFSHKWPHAFFSYPFSFDEWGPLTPKILHRVAGVIFTVLMLYHGGWLVFSKRGREKFVALLPRWQDFKDFIHLMKFNLGLSAERPRFGEYNYIEKAEYWALIWGAIVMILTGFVLMFENVSLQYLQKWMIDLMLVIHYYEAILASLAILVWHFYWAIFDPHVYPMNWSWLTGRHTEHQLEERTEEFIAKGKKRV